MSHQSDRDDYQIEVTQLGQVAADYYRRYLADREHMTPHKAVRFAIDGHPRIDHVDHAARTLAASDQDPDAPSHADPWREQVGHPDRPLRSGEVIRAMAEVVFYADVMRSCQEWLDDPREPTDGESRDEGGDIRPVPPHVGPEADQ